MPVLEKSILIPGCTPEEVFEFCLDGANFPAIFPEPIQAIGNLDPANLRIEAGREFHFRHWMFGIVPATWHVRIADVQSNQYFIDEMLKGPMKSFRHEHRVAEAPGSTLYTDRVEYAAIGGVIAERLFVDRYMRNIFVARHKNMLSLLKKIR